ncbi:MAG TPA: hypothetical protein VKH64_07400 [Candidatus Binatia bacterium]|nr:hypothetical protein [Candidatus Binatia bacterium]
MLAKQPAAALAVLLFFAVALVCAHSGRATLGRYDSIASRAAESGRAPVNQHRPLKRSVCLENAARSDGVRVPARFLSPKTPRNGIRSASFLASCEGLAPVQKVSTNLFLSVLNL